MITEELIESHFGVPDRIGNGILKFKDIVPKFSLTYYLCGGEIDCLAVCKDSEEDDLAAEVIGKLETHTQLTEAITNLVKLPLAIGVYSHVLLVPPSYHRFFRGRLDEQRSALVAVFPVHNCEFSGNETEEYFYEMQRSTIQLTNWERNITPKILLRFDNPKHKTGTIGDQEILAKFDLLSQEISNLDGVVNGFIEVTNYKNERFEIVCEGEGAFLVLHLGSEYRLNREDAIQKAWLILTA